MSVGTETEKFWDSLWELQAECTGLLWVERHPWARGDLDQSAHESDTSSDKTSRSERQTGKKETSTENQHHTTLQLGERGETHTLRPSAVKTHAQGQTSASRMEAHGGDANTVARAEEALESTPVSEKKKKNIMQKGKKCYHALKQARANF